MLIKILKHLKSKHTSSVMSSRQTNMQHYSANSEMNHRLIITLFYFLIYLQNLALKLCQRDPVMPIFVRDSSVFAICICSNLRPNIPVLYRSNGQRFLCSSFVSSRKAKINFDHNK